MDEHLPTGWGIIRHAGYHAHPWPRRGKPDKLSISKFGDRVVNNPSVGPLQHKVPIQLQIDILLRLLLGFTNVD